MIAMRNSYICLSHPFSTLLQPSLCPEKLTFGFQLDLAKGSTRSKSEESQVKVVIVPSFFLWDHGRFQKSAKEHRSCLVALSTWPSLSVDSENCAFPGPFLFTQRMASSLVIALNPACNFVNCPFIKLSCSDDYM